MDYYNLWCLVAACIVGLPVGSLLYGWGRVFAHVLAGTYTNDNVDVS